MCLHPKPVAFAPRSLQLAEGANALQKVLLSDVAGKGKEYVTERGY